MLELKHVSVEFISKTGTVKAVDDVNMTLSDGSRTAIVGETGSGKSILMLSVLRLLASNASVTGEILLNGEDILKADQKRLREIRGGEISYVPQGGGASMNPLLRVGSRWESPLWSTGDTKERMLKKRASGSSGISTWETRRPLPGAIPIPSAEACVRGRW